MKTRFLILSLAILLLLPCAVFAADMQVEYEGVRIEPDYPAPLDCYLVAYKGIHAEYDEWSTKLYSYDYIPGVDKEIQSVSIVSLSIDGTTVTAVDSRNVVYTIDARNGNLLSTDKNDYSLPDYTSNDESGGEKTDKNDTAIQLVIAFAVVVVILVFIASRKPKK